MAEYIDREKLKRDLIDNRSFYPAIVKNAIENAPTEDVVPRSLFDTYKRKVEDTLEELNTINKDKIKVEVFLAKQEVASKLIDDIVDFIWQSRGESFCLLIDGTFYGKEEMKEFLRKKYIGKDTDVPTNIGE